MFKHMTLEGRGGAVYVTLDRPPANALNDELIDELIAAAEQIEAGRARAAVVRSSQPIFMAGADLGVVEWTAEGIEKMNVRFQRTMQVWAHLTCPTVALINGHALGGGCELALACDWRIMARGRARIGLPEVRRGLLPAAGGTQRVLRLVGASRARDIAMLGRTLDADSAAAIGLVTEACDAEELESAGERLVAEILALPFMASVAIKRCLLEGAEVSLAEGLLIERREVVGLAGSADSVEGIRAFVEKREPEWSHR